MELNKTLTVSWECGSPLFRVFGIRFTRATPSKEEIDYASQLFSDYLEKHKATIKKIIKDQNKFNEQPILTMPARLKRNYRGSYTYSIADKVTFSFDLRESKVKNVSSISGVTLDNLSKIKFNKKDMDKAINELISFINYEKISEKFNNIQGLIDSCEL
jgi:hypothetical protein